MSFLLTAISSMCAEIFWPVLLVVVLVFFLVLMLLALSKYFPSDTNSLQEDILKRLPQTQCAQCGYNGCAPYAEALSKGDSIDKCVPGGARLIQELSELLGRQANTAVDESEEHPFVVREEDCIGCTKCIQACPVDCIIGARGMIHTILLSECTGCGLCVPPCPTGAIVPLPANAQALVRTKHLATNTIIAQSHPGS